MKVAVTRRPIELEVQAPASLLADILGRIEAITGRSALYGVTDPVRAKLLASESFEADFTRGDYRSGFVRTGSVTTLPGWAFSRTGAGSAYENDNGLVNFLTGVPRITGQGLLVEPQQTNLMTHSRMGTGWVANNSPTVTFNNLLGPDGTVTGTRVTAGSAVVDTGHYHVAAGTPGQPYSESFIVTNVSACTSLRLGPSGARVTVNPVAGTITSAQGGAINPTITPLAYGWHLVTFSHTATGSNVVDVVYTDLACSYGVWHAQLEQSAFVGSPIVTTGSTATRGADTVNVAWGNAFPISMVAEFEFNGTPGRVAVFDNSNAATYANMVLVQTAATSLTLDVTRNGSTVASLTQGGLVKGDRVRVAISVDENDVRLCVNGGAVLADTSASVPVGINLLSLGYYRDGLRLNGELRTVMAARIRMTDAELQGASA